MSFVATSLIGPGNITDIDTVARFQVGTTVKAVDPVLGEGEFIYLPGVASTVAGNAVIYDTYAKTTKLAVAGDRGPVAVAMAATVASTYGWYQVRGVATVKETGATAGANVYLTATAGVPSATTVAGDKIDGVRFKTADGTPAAGFAYAQVAYPSLNANG
jgi:hypothetical protein